MAETIGSSRIEVGLDGGQILSALVTVESADALERAVQERSAGNGRRCDAEDGRFTVVLARVAVREALRPRERRSASAPA